MWFHGCLLVTKSICMPLDGLVWFGKSKAIVSCAHRRCHVQGCDPGRVEIRGVGGWRIVDGGVG